MKIRLEGYIDIPADRMETVLAALPEHIRLTRAESGCISFEVTPSADVAGRYEVAEVFTNRASFDAHQIRAKSSKWAQVSQDIPRSYRIEEIE